MKCPDCGKRMILIEKNGRKILRCSNFLKCNVTHQAHENGKPMGYVANKMTRRARIRAHYALDSLWREEKIFSRMDAYKWLCQILNLHLNQAHISKFNESQCMLVVKKVKELKENYYSREMV